MIGTKSAEILKLFFIKLWLHDIEIQDSSVL